MMQYSKVLFDLDGTLTDPGEGITKSVAFALAHFGITVPSLEALYCFIGPPLSESFTEYYGFDEEKTATAIAKYREYFARQGIFENRLFDGISALLRDLKAAGKTLLLATSKPEAFAKEILKHFALDGYFSVVCGAPMHAPRGYGKADVIKAALERAGITDTADAVMVGDRHHDIDGAHQMGLAAIGVLFGYGSRAEHERAGADAIAASIEDLRALLLPNNKTKEI